MARTKTNAIKFRKRRKGEDSKKTNSITVPFKCNKIKRKLIRWRPGIVALRDIERY